MPILELLAWLLIAGGLLVIAGSIWLAFSIPKQVENEPVLLPGEWNSWKSENGPALSNPTNKKKLDLDLQKDREQEFAGAGPNP